MLQNLRILGAGVLIFVAACGGSSSTSTTTSVVQPEPDSSDEPVITGQIETIRAFETALWAGDVDAALTYVTEDFTYTYPFETISGSAQLRNAFGESEDHGIEGEVRVESTGFEAVGSTVVWTSVRYFPGSFGEAVSLSASFEGDQIASVNETGALTAVVDAIGCDDSFPYSWHADYGPEAVGVSDDPVAASIDGLPDAREDVLFEELDQDIESPMSGGHGSVVRASADGFTVGFVFLTERPDGSLLIDGVTGCDGYLESGFDEEDTEGHADFEGDTEGHADFDGDHDSRAMVDASGAAPTGGTPLPDVEGAVDGDDGSDPLPLGTVTTLPDSVQLDFLFELCHAVCFRDAHFLDPDDPEFGSGPFTADTGFHVRHGFPNNTSEPLGEGFDVVLYVTSLNVGDHEVEDSDEEAGEGLGETYRYTSDYVIHGTSEACGPNYRSQAGPVACEWFVHEFGEGLPEGRYALWAVWEAPCYAWVEHGFTDECTDSDEVLALFSSGVDSPFWEFPPDFTEMRERPEDG
jgi:hypothetical protein